jgi:hypothetical protein
MSNGFLRSGTRVRPSKPVRRDDLEELAPRGHIRRIPTLCKGLRQFERRDDLVGVLRASMAQLFEPLEGDTLLRAQLLL